MWRGLWKRILLRDFVHNVTNICTIYSPYSVLQSNYSKTQTGFYRKWGQHNMDNEFDYISSVKELTCEELAEHIDKDITSYDLSRMDWEEYLIHFTCLVSELKEYRNELAKKHSDIDQKICDILHYIELCETNDDEAVALIELLRVCRTKRRYIMDELQKADQFQNNLGTNENVEKAKKALKGIKGLETRKYKPRKYEELFQNGVLKEKG